MKNAITTAIIGIAIATGLYYAVKKEVRKEARTTELIVSTKVKGLEEQLKKYNDESRWMMYEATSPAACKKENMNVDLGSFTIGGVSFFSEKRELMGRFPCWTEVFGSNGEVNGVLYGQHGLHFSKREAKIDNTFRGRVEPDVFHMGNEGVAATFGTKVWSERGTTLYAYKDRCVGLEYGKTPEGKDAVRYLHAFKSSCDDVKKSWDEESKK